MRRRFAIALAAALATAPGCGPPVSVLDGAWQSDREETLAGLLGLAAFSEDQWQLLSDPRLFGETVHVYREGRALTVFGGRCGPLTTLEIARAGPSHVRFRYYDGWRKEHREKTVSVEGDALYVPIALFGNRAREVFRRVPLEEIERTHPCVAEAFGGFSPPNRLARAEASTRR